MHELPAVTEKALGDVILNLSDRGCTFFLSTGHLSSEKNGVSFSVQNGDVCLHDFSGKQLVFQEKDDTGSQKSHISLRRTSKRGSLTFIEKM